MSLLNDQTVTSTNLLADGEGSTASMTTSSLGVLTTNLEAPGVTETTMDADLLHALKVLTELVVEIVGEELTVASILDVLLTIEEVIRDLVLAGVLHDGDNTLEVSLVDLTSTRENGFRGWDKMGVDGYRLVMSISALRQQRVA